VFLGRLSPAVALKKAETGDARGRNGLSLRYHHVCAPVPKAKQPDSCSSPALDPHAGTPHLAPSSIPRINPDYWRRGVVVPASYKCNEENTAWFVSHFAAREWMSQIYSLLLTAANSLVVLSARIKITRIMRQYKAKGGSVALKYKKPGNGSQAWYSASTLPRSNMIGYSGSAWHRVDWLSCSAKINLSDDRGA